MKIFKDLHNKYICKKKGIIAIGYFDALHLGHNHLIKRLVEVSKQKKLGSFLLTYLNLPKKSLDNKGIIETKFKINEIRKMGVNNLILLNYDENFYTLDPNKFLNLLKNNFYIEKFLIGKDFSFGKDRSGNVVTLLENGFSIEVIEPFMIDGEYVSTSLIKRLIINGEIERANNLLGYPFFIEGIVKKGKQLGRKLGFPTMNIVNEKICYPLEGSYATITSIGDNKYYSMTYVSKDIIETNLFGYTDFHYNFKIKIDFFKKIRDNRLFDSLNELKSQLYIDLSTVRNYFNL
ncbi:MAG TPA: riboflavin biosynthesis protein RibF [Spirochaetota bacterium]|nr:riboflavin biosynthesis protein RibF [Spirochaetota bacterium]